MHQVNSVNPQNIPMSYFSFVYSHFTSEKPEAQETCPWPCSWQNVEGGLKDMAVWFQSLCYCQYIGLKLLGMGLPLATMSTPHRYTAVDFQKDTASGLAAGFPLSSIAA